MHTRRLYILGALFIFTAFILHAAFSGRNGVLTIAFLDIGQGDATFIQTPSGQQMLIDGGPDASVLRRLGEMMPLFDNGIDVVLGTHDDKDHIGGLADVYNRYTVAVSMDPGMPGTTATWRAYRDAEVAEGSRYIIARRGQTIDFGDGVYVRILYPVNPIARGDTNITSVVAQVVYGDTKIILTGDAPRVAENYILAREGPLLQSDILKAGHHGSRTSSDPTFVAAVHPVFGIISSGKGNTYGHPHQETLNTLGAVGAIIDRTDREGTIVFTGDGKTIQRR